METSDGISKVWVTNEAPVGLFGGMFQTDNIPEGMPDFGSKTLFMEMEYTPKDKKDDHFSMVCTELKAESMAIHKKDYQSMAMGCNKGVIKHEDTERKRGGE